jgi:hypothetical protein
MLQVAQHPPLRLTDAPARAMRSLDAPTRPTRRTDVLTCARTLRKAINGGSRTPRPHPRLARLHAPSSIHRSPTGGRWPPLRRVHRPSHRSTTLSPSLVTPTKHTQWSLIALPGSPSPWTNCSSPPRPPQHCLPPRPLSVARSPTPTCGAPWKRNTRPSCPIGHGTWYHSLQGPTSSPACGSSITSLRLTVLLTGTRHVGCFGGSPSTLAWTSMRLSPVVKHASVRTVLTLVLSQCWLMQQLDVKNTFLHDTPRQSTAPNPHTSSTPPTPSWCAGSTSPSTN